MIPPLVLPKGHMIMNSPPPCVQVDAGGVWYYGAQTKINKERYAFRVYRQGTTGAAEPIETGIEGQGRMDIVAGQLVVSGCAETGDGKPVATFVVPGFVGPAVPGPQVMVITPDSPIGQLWRGGYTAANFDTPGETALRSGKQLAALNQLVDMLVAAGLARRT